MSKYIIIVKSNNLIIISMVFTCEKEFQSFSCLSETRQKKKIQNFFLSKLISSSLSLSTVNRIYKDIFRKE